MPATPPVIYVPPSAGGAPPAAGAIFEPAPAGKGLLAISGVSTSGVNGQVVYAGLIQNRPAWSTNGTQTAGAANVIVEYTGTAWKVSLGSAYSATKTSGATTPDGLTAWTVGTGTGSPTLAAFTAATPPVVTA